MIKNGLYSRVAARLEDFLNTSSMNVENGNLALDLINRGQERLEMECDWEPLFKTSALPIDSDRIAILPDDCEKIVRVYFDPIGLGKAMGYYSKDGDLIYGYKRLTEYSIDKGITKEEAQFFFLQPFFPTLLVYLSGLPRFTDTQDPQYSFFPESLLLRAAQLEHLEENDATNPNTLNNVTRAYELAKFNFKKRVVGVNADYRNTIKDWSGNQVQVQSYSPDGGVTQARTFSPSFDNRYGSYTV